MFTYLENFPRMEGKLRAKVSPKVPSGFCQPKQLQKLQKIRDEARPRRSRMAPRCSFESGPALHLTLYHPSCKVVQRGALCALSKPAVPVFRQALTKRVIQTPDNLIRLVCKMPTSLPFATCGPILCIWLDFVTLHRISKHMHSAPLLKIQQVCKLN